MIEQVGEVAGALLLFVVDVVLEFFDFGVGVEIDTGHGALGFAIDFGEHALGGHVWVPIDDHQCWAWSIN